jgi:hypothetical protein
MTPPPMTTTRAREGSAGVAMATMIPAAVNATAAPDRSQHAADAAA